jgi:DNA-directed RNA polymerase specialized sigma24 family protein
MDFDYEHLYPYFLRVAYRLGVPEMWREDAAQEMALAVWEAPATANWKTVAGRQGIDFMRSKGHLKRTPDGPAGGRYAPTRRHPMGMLRYRRKTIDKAETINIETVSFLPLRGTTRFEDTSAERLDLENDWRVLRERQAFVLLMYAVGYTWREVGRRLGVTETRACQIGKDARRRLLAQRAASAGRP